MNNFTASTLPRYNEVRLYFEISRPRVIRTSAGQADYDQWHREEWGRNPVAHNEIDFNETFNE